MSGTYDFATNPNARTIENGVTLDNDTLIDEGFRHLWDEHPDMAFNVILKRANSAAKQDLEQYKNYENIAYFNPKAFDVIEKHIPLRQFDRTHELGRRVEGVPYQVVDPVFVMPAPMPGAVYTNLTGGSELSSAPSTPSTPPAKINKQPSPKKQLASPRKVNRSPRRKASSLNTKPKLKAPPVPSPRSRVSKVKYQASTKNHAKPRSQRKEADPVTPSSRKGKAPQKPQPEDVEMDEEEEGDEDDEEEYVPSPQASPRKKELPTKMVTTGEDIITARPSVFREEGGAPREAEICHDISDIPSYGEPRTHEQQVIEKILAIAKKNWHLIKRQDKKIRTARKETNLTGRVPCLIPGCAHRSLNGSCLRKHLCSHFPNVVFCPVCLRAFSRECSFARHAPGSCRAKLVKEFAFEGAGARNHYQWFNLYFLGLRDDVEMPPEAFHQLAGRAKDEPLY